MTFQFLKGAIKRMGAAVVAYGITNFNSLKVRLKVSASNSSPIWCTPFQFLKGAIKSATKCHYGVS